MSTPAAKRRRVDTANATLRKPFNSPVIRRPADANGTTTPGSSKTSDVNLRKLTGENETPQTPIAKGNAALQQFSKSYEQALQYSPQLSSSPQLKRKAASLHQSLGRNSSSRKQALWSDNGAQDNPFVALVTAHKKEQDVVIKDLNQRLETVRQARQIEAQSEKRMPGMPVDQEMRDLVGKWKSASRQAAEELFELVKERVASAGGSKAWKDMQQRQRDFFQGFDVGEVAKTKSRDGDSLGWKSEHKEHEGFSNEDDEPKSDGQEDEEASGDGSDSEFNMLGMLQSLNIDPSLLGYNGIEDRWID